MLTKSVKTTKRLNVKEVSVYEKDRKENLHQHYGLDYKYPQK